MNKEDAVYICNEIFSTMREEAILPFAAICMNAEGIMLSEISQTEKDKCFTYV